MNLSHQQSSRLRLPASISHRLCDQYGSLHNKKFRLGQFLIFFLLTAWNIMWYYLGICGFFPSVWGKWTHLLLCVLSCSIVWVLKNLFIIHCLDWGSTQHWSTVPFPEVKRMRGATDSYHWTERHVTWNRSEFQDWFLLLYFYLPINGYKLWGYFCPPVNHAKAIHYAQYYGR